MFSFKLRGAYNGPRWRHLDPSESWKGVICCSAGNHAQGVAYSARKLKIPATIVMPKGTPSIKHKNVSRLGGHVVLHGADSTKPRRGVRQEGDPGALHQHPLRRPLCHCWPRHHPGWRSPIPRPTSMKLPGHLLLRWGRWPCRRYRRIRESASRRTSRSSASRRVMPTPWTQSWPRESACCFRGRRPVQQNGAAVKTVGEENFRICQPQPSPAPKSEPTHWKSACNTRMKKMDLEKQRLREGLNPAHQSTVQGI